MVTQFLGGCLEFVSPELLAYIRFHLLLSCLLVSLRSVSGAPPSNTNANCPQPCFCNQPSKIVYCSRRGLVAIPNGIPPESLQLNLNGNQFLSPALQKSNFSGYIRLEHLYLSECGIEQIQVDTFADLVSLRWLDLSNNRIRTLTESSFSGLTLQHLFLNGNRQLILRPDSFEGLVTVGLYLHDCSLTSLQPEVFLPLNSTLRYLWLNGNELERIDFRFREIFSTLSHLRLGSNPLHCNCESSWMKEFYDGNTDVFKGAAAPSCSTPIRARGRHFGELSLQYDFRCNAPAFSNIETEFGTTSGRLKCTANGDPIPTLYWIQPSGKTTRYSPTDDSTRTPVKNEATLTLDGGSLEYGLNSGMFICVANNAAGNATLTINVTWPITKWNRDSITSNTIISTNSVIAQHRPFVGIESERKAISNQIELGGGGGGGGKEGGRGHKSLDARLELIGGLDDQDLERARNNYTVIHVSTTDDGARIVGVRPRLFSVVELVFAVVGTHLCTLVLCILAVPVLCRKRWIRAKSSSSSLHHHHQTDLLQSPPKGRLEALVASPAESTHLNTYGRQNNRYHGDYSPAPQR